MLLYEDGEEFKPNRSEVKSKELIAPDVLKDLSPPGASLAEKQKSAAEVISPTCRSIMDDTESKTKLVVNGKIYKQITSMDQNSNRFLVEDSNDRISAHYGSEIEKHTI